MRSILISIVLFLSLSVDAHKMLIYSHDGYGVPVYGQIDNLISAVKSGSEVSIVVRVHDKFEVFKPQRLIIESGHVFGVHRLELTNASYNGSKLIFNNKLKGVAAFGTNGLETLKLDGGAEYNNRLYMEWYID